MPSDQQNTSPPVKKREIFGWAMYDFANSSFTTVVISVIYAPFFVDWVVPESTGAKDSLWSLAIVISTLLAMVLSPFVGAVCDYGGGKKRFLAASTLVCAIATALLYVVGPGDVWLAIGLLTFGNAAFMVGESFCGSFLPELATKKTMGIISGLGWGLGYFGGLISLLLVMAIVGDVEPEQDLMTFVSRNQVAMITIGGFYLLSALPTFFLVRERSRPKPGFEQASFMTLSKVGFKELGESFKLARQYPVLFKFFIAFTLYIAGMEVVVKFVGIYARSELKMTMGDLTIIFLIIQVSAAIGALLFGVLESRLGAKRTVLLTIAWWICGVLGIFFLYPISELTGFEPRQVFFVIGLIAGAGLGSIQSSSRAVVGLLSPPGRSAQMFGFWGMFNRIAIILGMSFGPVSDYVGRQNAMLLVVGFFVAGGALLWRVPIDSYQQELQDASPPAP